MARILIVDDDQTVRNTLGTMLERAGYDVQLASDGNEGLKLFFNSPPDLVITDLIMPEKEGIETIFEMRHSRPEIKIIAISGGGRGAPEKYLEIASAVGAARTFVKPIARKEFLDGVRELVSRVED